MRDKQFTGMAADAPQASVRHQVAIGVVLAALAVGAAIFFAGGRQAPVAAVAATSVVEGPVTITVHVSGAVADPGLVEVASTARVADVIAAAGGTTPDAVMGGVNLAAAVRDGEQIVVPAAGSGEVEPGNGLIHLNSASAAELEAIPGVGPVLAGRIVDERDARGGFDVIEDLLDVSGIGEAKLAALRDLVAVP